MSRMEKGQFTPRTAGSLLNRTERIIRLFDAEKKDYAFGDSGDAESYATEMAELLERWAHAQRMSMAMHPSTGKYSA